jgi:hypothetical protein
MQNPAILESNRRKSSIWSKKSLRNREASADCQREFENIIVKAEKSMLTIEEESWSLKLETSYILRFHQWDEREDLRLKVNYLLAISAHSKFWKEKCEVAYQLELPDSLSNVHDVFNVSQLKKCLRVPEEQLPIEELNVNEDLTFLEYPIRILETSRKITRSKVINMYKVQWSHHSEDEATWEREDELITKFSQLFSNSFLILRTRFF